MSAAAAVRISVVTPSYNQAPFLEQTLRSVLDQGYENLEYVVVDGGSTDGSADIIARHADRLAWWVSEPDGGHADALNKGFSRTSGEVMAWLNSDDLYLPWTLHAVAEVFTAFPEVDWITGTASSWNAQGRLTATHPFRRNVHDYLFGEYRWIQQESVFWRRRLWDRAGARIDAASGLALDAELWTRFFPHAPLCHVECVIGGFRHHSGNRGRLEFGRYMRELHGAAATMRARLAPAVLEEHRRLRRLRAIHRRLPGARLRAGLARRSAETLLQAGYDVIAWTDRGWTRRREPFGL